MQVLCWICNEPGYKNKNCPKREERGRSKSREKEETSLILVKEDSHQKEGDIPLIQREKERRREIETIGLEMTVLVSQVQRRTGPADLGQDLILAQKQNKTLHQGEKSKKEVEDQTETKADTIKMIIIRVIEW